MRSTPIRVEGGAGALHGELLLPDGAGPHPAALLLPGSGPIDRDGNHRRMRLDIQRRLALALADVGVASVRYDRRGVGASDGTFLAAGFGDNVDDAGAVLDHLRTLPRVDPARVVVVGHSEGALLAAAAVARTPRAPAVAGVVLLSCSARRGDDLLLWQARQVAGDLPRPVRAVLRLLRQDLVARVAANHDRIRATTDDVVRMDGARVNARWHREFMAHDPRTDLARLDVPVLALTGTKDVQVPVEDLDVLAAAVPGPVTTRAVADLNHLLRPQEGPATMRTYRRDVKVPPAPTVLAEVAAWVAARTGASTSGRGTVDLA